jgi:CRISPR-associated protein Csx17
MSYALPLPGCAPIPLAHYLKALGILRLVAESEHGDRAAKGCWQGDRFVLHSRFDREGLADFFFESYVPTPVLAPWNGGSGFYFQEEKLNEKDPGTGKKRKTGKRNQPTEATRVVEAIATTTDSRFSVYRSSIQATRAILHRRGYDRAPDGCEKDDLLIELRGCWPDDAVCWLDCVLVLVSDSFRARSMTGLVPSYTTLLGSGANDGNADFSSNFMQRLATVLLDSGNIQSGCSRGWFLASLFGCPTPRAVINALAGQYSPGNAGGPNMTSGFKGDSSVNPWDFILLIEGSLAFAAAAVKRHGETGPSALASPFAVRTSGAGYASGSPKDEVADKSHTEELWLPLWEKRTSIAELLSVLSEGRAQIGKSAATNGVDFARSICGCGTERGFSEFVRYGFLTRRGDSSSATPLGRFRVRRDARVDLLSEADAWLARLRQQASPLAKKAPAAVTGALNQLERHILELCSHGGAGRLLDVLAALGATERAVAGSLKWAKHKDVRIAPLFGLSSRWLEDANDNSVEYRLAVALAGVSASLGKGQERLRLRQHLEPLRRADHAELRRPEWTDKNSERDVVWHEGDLVSALNAIAARRLMRFQQAGADGWPDWSPRCASLADIIAFIEGRVNEDLLADLLWGIACVDRAKAAATPSATETGGSGESEDDKPPAPDAAPSAFYALLKLCHHRLPKGEGPIPLVPAILNRAMNGDGTAASELAARRLRASGLRPLVYTLPVTGDIARRTAAAVLFPIKDVSILKRCVLQTKEDAR